MKTSTAPAIGTLFIANSDRLEKIHHIRSAMGPMVENEKHQLDSLKNCQR